MLRFIDDLAGAIKDLLKTVFVGFCYFVAGMIIVGVPIGLLYVLLMWIGSE